VASIHNGGTLLAERAVSNMCTAAISQNQERVWKAEQAHKEEQKKIEELRGQRQEERQIEELRAIQDGGRQRQQRLEWMYSGEAAMMPTSDEYLLGKEWKADEDKDDVSRLNSDAALPGANFISSAPAAAAAAPAGGAPAGAREDPLTETQARTKEFAVKQHDPLFAMKSAEASAREQVLSNPLMMARIKQQLMGVQGGRSDTDSDSSHGGRRHRRRHRHRSSADRSSRRHRSKGGGHSDDEGGSSRGHRRHSSRSSRRHRDEGDDRRRHRDEGDDRRHHRDEGDDRRHHRDEGDDRRRHRDESSRSHRNGGEHKHPRQRSRSPPVPGRRWGGSSSRDNGPTDCQPRGASRDCQPHGRDRNRSASPGRQAEPDHGRGGDVVQQPPPQRRPGYGLQSSSGRALQVAQRGAVGPSEAAIAARQEAVLAERRAALAAAASARGGRRAGDMSAEERAQRLAAMQGDAQTADAERLAVEVERAAREAREDAAEAEAHTGRGGGMTALLQGASLEDAIDTLRQRKGREAHMKGLD